MPNNEHSLPKAASNIVVKRNGEKKFYKSSRELIVLKSFKVTRKFLTILRDIHTQVHSIMVHVFVETTTENMDKMTKLTVTTHAWPPLTRFVGAVAVTQSTEHQVIN